MDSAGKENKIAELRGLFPKCRVELCLAPGETISIPLGEGIGFQEIRCGGWDKGYDMLVVFNESRDWFVPLELDAHGWEHPTEGIASIIKGAFKAAAEDMALRIKMAFEEVGVKEVKDGIQSRG